MRLPRRLYAVLLLALLILGCGKKPAPDAAPEPTPTPAAPPPVAASGIEGTYLIVGAEMWGEKATDESITKDSELDRTVKINKDRIQFKLGTRGTVRYTLDASKSPAEIDLFSDEPGKKAKASYGIYKVEGKTLTVFLVGAEEPRLRPREFKTLVPVKDGKLDPDIEKQPGGTLILTLTKVSDDTTFITDPPPPPPPADVDTPLVAELKKKGFEAEIGWSYNHAGVFVTVPAALPPEAVKGLNGHPRIRAVTFKARVLDGPHKVTDEAVQSLDKLDGMVVLKFDGCPKLTAGAFRNLYRFPMLTTVSASGTPVDDLAVEEIAGLKALRRVEFVGTTMKLTDKSLAALAKTRTLKEIWLSDVGVTAAGIKQLTALPDLEVLWLQNMPVADKTLGEINLPKLKELNLARSDITDGGLSKLPVLPALERITLSGPGLTDRGLLQLQKQPRLQDVTLFDTKVTKTGADELKKLRPKLSISGAE